MQSKKSIVKAIKYIFKKINIVITAICPNDIIKQESNPAFFGPSVTGSELIPSF